MDNFADHPKSLAEVKSDKSGRAGDWTARDCLITLLRRIDSGELVIKDNNLVVCYEYEDENNKKDKNVQNLSYSTSVPKVLAVMGLLEMTKLKIFDNSSEH